MLFNEEVYEYLMVVMNSDRETFFKQNLHLSATASKNDLVNYASGNCSLLHTVDFLFFKHQVTNVKHCRFTAFLRKYLEFC